MKRILCEENSPSFYFLNKKLTRFFSFFIFFFSFFCFNHETVWINVLCLPPGPSKVKVLFLSSLFRSVLVGWDVPVEVSDGDPESIYTCNCNWLSRIVPKLFLSKANPPLTPDLAQPISSYDGKTWMGSIQYWKKWSKNENFWKIHCKFH